MGKPRTPGSVANRPIYSRISFLYQAASYLGSNVVQDQHDSEDTEQNTGKVANQGQSSLPAGHKQQKVMSMRLLTDLRAASLKAQIRLSPAMKRTICKFCDSLLIEGQSCTSVVENKSKGGKKPWADVLVITCNSCGGVKRFPVHAPRQKRRPFRETEAHHEQTALSKG